MQSDTLGDVGAEEVVDSLADTLAEVEDEIVGDTMGDVESEALLDTLANTVKVVESETLGERLGDKALVNTVGFKG